MVERVKLVKLAIRNSHASGATRHARQTRPIQRLNTTRAQSSTHALRPCSRTLSLLHQTLTSIFFLHNDHTVFGTSARDTNTITVTPLRRRHPIRRPALTKSPSTRKKIRHSCPLYACGSPRFASLVRPSASPVPPQSASRWKPHRRLRVCFADLL
jgi:hypothetical protein